MRLHWPLPLQLHCPISLLEPAALLVRTRAGGARWKKPAPQLPQQACAVPARSGLAVPQRAWKLALALQAAMRCCRLCVP